MKRIKALSIALALALVFSLLPMTAFAEDGSISGNISVTTPEEAEQYEDVVAEKTEIVANSLPEATVKGAAVVTPTNINSSATPSKYTTKKASSNSDKDTYTLSMPSAGTAIVTYYAPTSPSVRINGNDYDDRTSFESGGVTWYSEYWYVGGGSSTLDIYLNSTGNQAVFFVYYAPASMNITPGSTAKTYLLGRPASSSSVSSFKLKAPSNGYFDLTMGDDIRTYGVYYKTAGFSDYEYLSQSDARRYIGVKKGLYTISVKSYTPVYGVKVKFNKVKESKYGTKKGKAKSIKRNKTIKGLIITNKKKAHWYKIKNPKNQKLKLYVNAKKLSKSGNYSGAVKITVYFPNKKSQYTTLYAGRSDSWWIRYGTIGTKKARAGTYYVKIQSYNGGNGYFTIKWK